MKKIIYILFLSLIISPGFSQDERVSAFYSQVVRIAKESIGLKRVPPINGKYFTSDCIGFVRYVYYRAGFDLVSAYGGNGRGGVSLLYNGLARYGFTYKSKQANPGDLVFFDNTYDVNRNGKWDDPLSHIGIITGAGEYNTLHYIHFANHGVAEDELNLYYPNTHAFRQPNGNLFVINSYLRVNRGEGYAKKDYVAAFFYRAFAHIRLKAKD